MLGLMQDRPLLISSLIEFAALHHSGERTGHSLGGCADDLDDAADLYEGRRQKINQHATNGHRRRRGA